MDIFEKEDTQVATFRQDNDPLELYLQGYPEQRSEIILHHPQVIGFYYITQLTVMKAFFQKKIINWNTSDPEDLKVIAVVSGTTSEFTPFTVPESVLFGDQIHLGESPRLHKKVPISQVSKYVKENR